MSIAGAQIEAAIRKAGLADWYRTLRPEPFLRRKPRARIAWRDIGLMALGAVLCAIAFFVFLMAWGQQHAHAEGVAGVIRDGVVMTPESFCDTL